MLNSSAFLYSIYVGANSVRPLCLPDKLTISAQYLAQYSEEVAYQHKFAIKSCGRTLFAPTMCQRVMQNIFISANSRQKLSARLWKKGL